MEIGLNLNILIYVNYYNINLAKNQLQKDSFI